MGSTPKKALILARSSRGVLPREPVLDRIAQALPERAHPQIWSALEIFDTSGAPHEIDAVVLGHYGLYVVDVKHLSRRIVGDELTWSVQNGDGQQQVLDNPLPRVRSNARRLGDFLVQELGGEGLSVEPLILLPDDSTEVVLPESTRRCVVTTSELLRGLRSGELPGDAASPRGVPLDALTAQAIADILGGLQRRVRPGRGSFQQELSLLQRDLVADLTHTVAGSPDLVILTQGRGDELHEQIEEAAAGWAIACVFVRVLEERGYIDHQLAGEGAEERERGFLAGNPSRTQGGYLMHVLSTLGQYPACISILGQGNRWLWDMPPTEDAAAALLAFFRTDDDRTRHRRELFSEALWGDLYQSISEPLRKTKALVHTPSIIEDFLLAQVLEPAVAERGISQVRVLDPACGSGTLLVGAFRRMLRQNPSSSTGDRAIAVLDQVHGVDISPAVTLIARIRLLLAYCEATGCSRLSEAPVLPLHVVTADSLLAPDAAFREQSAEQAVRSSPSHLLTQRYPVVVCIPPLVSARKPALREAYRKRYRSAARNAPLSSPFIERCFQLADDGGFVGVLAGNSFMKREFGKTLVEEVLPAVDLTHVVDTSSTYIPGYSAPTVILLGRGRPPMKETVRVVLGKRAEPIAPIHPGEGRAWSSIVTHLNYPGYEDDYIAVSDVRRDQLAKHPWSLGAHDVMALRQALEQGAVGLQDLVASVRRGARSGLDQVYILPRHVADRLGLESEVLRSFVRGPAIRDFSFSTEEIALVPQAHDVPRGVDPQPRWLAWLQRFRPLLASRKTFGAAAPTSWSDWLQRPRDPGHRMRLVGPALATSNHFAFVRGDLVVSSTVVIIEAGDGRSENELYSWLGFLNSSTASFWVKQAASSMGYVNGADPHEPWYDLAGVINRLPIPRTILEPGVLGDQLAALARQLEGTAQELTVTAPDLVLSRWDRSSRESLVESLANAQLRERTLSRRMVCEQEDLDWLVYEAVGLTNGEYQIQKGSASPEQRPFAWLTDDPPVGLDRRLAEAWRRRRRLGREDDLLRVLEAAPYKRAFRGLQNDRGIDLEEPRDDLDTEDALPVLHRRGDVDYERRTALACEGWLLDRLEESFRDTPPRCASVQELASRLAAVAGARFVVGIRARERGELSGALIERYVVDLVGGHAVPYLAALRYTESGLEKWAQWETAWVLQRRKDAGELVAPIPVPPRYDRTDYRDATTFHHRGGLDVATERFIVYPGEGDAEPRYGWAGWSPIQQAEVLVAVMEQNQDAGRAAECFAPLLAGIMELAWWMPSWDGVVPVSGSAAETFQLKVQNEARRLGLRIEMVRAWRPSVRDRAQQGKGNRRS